MEREFDAQTFTVDYRGTPGKRAFFIQARGSQGTHTFALEKQQVVALAEKLAEMLMMIDASDTVAGTEPVRDPALNLVEGEPTWRIGTIALAYEEPDDKIVVVIQPVEEEDEQDESVRFLLRRDQVRAFVLHGLAVVSEGRPLCQLCGLPMDPEGHACPASNGHRPHV